MSFDWNQLESIFSTRNLESLTNNEALLNLHLTWLLQELKELETATQCYERYPKLAPLLTLASTHPYIGYYPANTKLLLSCLIEYAKLDLSTDHITLSKPLTWCLIRLRHLVHAAPNRDQKLHQRITQLMDEKQYALSSQTISRLSNACLGLVHDESSFILIEKIVSCALNQLSTTRLDASLHFDQPQKVLSDGLIGKLALHPQCYIDWQNDLKTKLLLTYQELLTGRVLDLIETYVALQDRYQCIHDLFKNIKKEELVRLACVSQELSEVLMSVLAGHVVLLHDWRVVRIMQCIYRAIRADSCEFILHYRVNQPPKRMETLAQLQHFIYAGAISNMETRRDTVWCAWLASTRCLWHCVFELIQWCQTSNPWTAEMEDNAILVNNVIYPTHDVRESYSLSNIKSLLQSCQGKNKLHLYLPQVWHVLLNDNGVVLSCFITSILLATLLSMDQKIAMIRNAYLSSGRGMIYLLLDQLYDIQMHPKEYPTNVDMIPQIINLVKTELATSRSPIL